MERLAPDAIRYLAGGRVCAAEEAGNSRLQAYNALLDATYRRTNKMGLVRQRVTSDQRRLEH